MEINIDEAKTQLARLGRLAWADEEIVITKAGEPYLRLEPYRPASGRRPLGAFQGQIELAPDFDDTPQDVVDAFNDWELDSR